MGGNNGSREDLRSAPAPEADDVLADISQQICEGREPDWKALFVAHPARREQIERLRRVHEVDSAFRRTRDLDPVPDGHAAATGTPTRELQANDPDHGHWGPLRLVRPLGRGSFGTVWRARDPMLERDVALKLAEGADDRQQRHILDEGRRLARIDHPSVVRVHGAAVHDGVPGIWMDLAEGRTLEERLQQDGRFAEDEVLGVARTLTGALAAVHSAGVVHGDLKAANVLRRDGGALVLADFGSSLPRVEGSEILPASASPIYAAPEILLGEPSDARDDIYSLGVLLYTLLTGAFPVEATTQSELLTAHESGQRTRLRARRPEVSAGFAEIVERALDPRDRRWQSALALQQALESLVPNDASAQKAPIVRVTATLAVLGLVSLLWWWTSNSPSSTGEQAGDIPSAFPTSESSDRSTRSDQGNPGPASVETEISGTLDAADDATPAPGLLDEVRLDLFRADRTPALANGDPVRVGDALHLRVTGATVPLWLYVVNQDAAGDAFVLFPIDGLEPTNPLPAGTHRLPGSLEGIEQDWIVTSDGGTEGFLLLASRTRLQQFESALANLDVASAERAGAAPNIESDAVRGVGGLGAARTAELDDVGLLESLLQRAQEEAPHGARGRIVTLRGDG